MDVLKIVDLFRLADGSIRIESEKNLLHVMQKIRLFFLLPYTDGVDADKAKRRIQGNIYIVERANHGLAHGLRQGALAKDILNLLVHYSFDDVSGIVQWARRKMELDPQWIEKVQMAASFQRSGRQRECSSQSHPDLYKKYELQDMVNFKNAVQEDPLFSDEFERVILGEAILWSNPGSLDENEIEDLKYLRRILHAAHTLDLRRMLFFDAKRIQKDAMDQLFGGLLPLQVESIEEQLWERSGAYLEVTGDRDLVSQRDYQDSFFTLNRSPEDMVDAINSVSQRVLFKK